MIQVKQPEIRTTTFEEAYYRAIKETDEMKHATEAAKEETKRILRKMYDTCVTYKREIEIPEFLNVREQR